jgi:hypothetical protein
VVLPAACYSTYPLITIEHELARFESVFLKVFQPGGQHYPAVLTGTPQLPLGQQWELSGKALEVLIGSEDPEAISPRALDTIAKCEKKPVIQVDVRGAKHSLDSGAKRNQLFKYKWKGTVFLKASIVFHGFSSARYSAIPSLLSDEGCHLV